ncbi:MAG: polyprenyl synthetase family protein [Myxococcota bacterium]
MSISRPHAAGNSLATRLHDLQETYLPEVLAAIHSILRDTSPEDSSLVSMTEYHFETGGKRLRALLPLLVADLMGEDPERNVPFGAACEMLHNATLVHDDLQDGDTHRRGRPAVWTAFGAPQAINLGDAMFHYGLLLLHRSEVEPAVRERVARRMMQDTIAIIDGQEREFALKTEPQPQTSQYFRMVEGKTSALFALCLDGAAELCGAGEPTIRALREVGRQLGVLFQVQDDLLDLYGAKGRDRVGQDIAEGKRSAMVVHALNFLEGPERDELQYLVDKSRDETTDADIRRAKDILEASGSIAFSQDEIERRRRAALDAASATGDRRLQELAEFLADLFVEPLASAQLPPRPQNAGASEVWTPDHDAFMRRILPEVSRTFALSIEALPEELRDAVRISYLLCRMLDTVEDEAGLSLARRHGLFDAFDGVLSGKMPASAFANAPEWSEDASNPEYTLCRHAEAVFKAFEDLPDAMQEAVRPHVLEMAAGMREYTSRMDRFGQMRIRDLEDLDRYCYYVAGTVGLLLTELFLLSLPPEQANQVRPEAEARAVEFGQGLQLVNIIKDVSTDSERGVCYMPEDLASALELKPEDLVRPEHRKAALQVLGQVLSHAHQHLDRAIEYTLVWPEDSAEDIRFFCAVPLGLALATLDEVSRSNDALRPSQTPKVGRRTVMAIFEQARRAVGSNFALHRLLAALRRGESIRPDQPEAAAI